MATAPTLAALEALYRQRRDAFDRTASAIAGESSLGQDAVHDAFVLAVRHRRRFRGEGTLEA
jgi:DNA-directed RNA polymerase specialized sigma24 family protein